MKKLRIKLPKGINITTSNCPKCTMRMYEVKGDLICGNCQLINTKEKYLKAIKAHYDDNPDALENFHKEVQAKKKTTGRDNKSKAWKD